MTGHYFDRLTRLLAGSRSRRQALAALGAMAFARSTPVHAATQIEIAACGEAGAVCTMIKGCCSGLVCATSYLNPAYGVCVTGEGDMLPVSDDIVVPTGDGIEVELAQEVSEAATASAAAQSALTTEQTERQTRITTRRTNKQSRRTARRSKNNTQQSTRRSNRSARRTTQELNAVPELTVEFFAEVDPDPADPDDTGQPEMVRIRNHDTVSVLLSRLESITHPDVFKALTTTISAGGTHLLLSGQYAEDAIETMSGATIWTEETVCPAPGAPDAGEGIHLTAAHSGGTRTHLFTVLCNGSISTARAKVGTGQARRRKRNHDERQRSQERRRKSHHKQRDRRRAKKSNGR
jgi:hypothetical protein